MKTRAGIPLLFLCALLLFPYMGFAEETFVVTADVVFVRTAPDQVQPYEKLTVEELYKVDEYDPPYPSHFYGENLSGETFKPNPSVAVIKQKFMDRTTWKETEGPGYVDMKKLWAEPRLSPPSNKLHMAVKDATLVRLLPKADSKEVMSLYQGEVVEAVGELKYNGGHWIKLKFANRYGYIEASHMKPLVPGKVDGSTMELSEVPKTGRYSDLTLTDVDKARLAKDGFYIEPLKTAREISVDDMADLYKGTNSALFLTSDIFLHSFHLVFDRMLQDIESKKLLPAINAMTLKLLEHTNKEYAASKTRGDKAIVQEALLQNVFFFSVAARLFDPKSDPPGSVRDDALKIVERITKAEGKLPSLDNKIPLGEEDFTQYKLRGHYEVRPVSAHTEYPNGHPIDVPAGDDDTLARYFRGMMWYGRRSLLVKDDTSVVSSILIIKALEDTGETKNWTRLNSVLTLIFGKTDDWTPEDYKRVLVPLGIKPSSIDTAFISKNHARLIKNFRAKAFEILPPQKIVSVQTGLYKTPKQRLEETAGFKFLGQRYTPDAYIFGQLTSPSVGSNSNPRNLPASTDVMAVLGSRAADELNATAFNEHRWDNYTEKLAGLKKEINPEVDKKETAYTGWLDALGALFAENKTKQLFAKGAPWQFKSLNTALGSWTELKHDTILYTEQIVAESGGPGRFELPAYIPPQPRGYVEPVPWFFDRLGSLSKKIRTTLSEGYLTDEFADKLTQFEAITRRAYEISKKEAEDSAIDAKDYEWLRHMSDGFDARLLLPIGGSQPEILDPEQLKMALIADVATDAVEGRVLEVAVGYPQRMVVIVKDAFGGTRLTTGYVYSWYEFANTERLNDTEWKARVYSEKPEDKARLDSMRPSWYSRFLK